MQSIKSVVADLTSSRPSNDQVAEAAKTAGLKQPIAVPLEIAMRVRRLDRGQSALGVVKFDPNLAAPLTLEATSDTDGYGFRFIIDDARSGSATLMVACYEDRGPHTVGCSIALRDRHGSRGNAVSLPIECTGRSPAGMLMKAVSVDRTQVPLGATTPGIARFAPPGRPVTLEARGDKPGHAWDANAEANDTELRFSLGCYANRGAYDVKWSFVVRDSQGWGSNPQYVTINCR